MNVKLAAIFARRSVRHFTDATIDELSVRDLLDAAMAAPSAMATDPWSFVVVRQRDTLNAMAEILPNGKMLRQAPLSIVVCGVRARAHRGLESYLLQDCSAAMQNILLAATMLGLGACWLGVHPNEERMAGLAKLLNLPDGVIAMAAVAVGVPAEFPPPRTRSDPSRIHYERYTNATPQ